MEMTAERERRSERAYSALYAREPAMGKKKKKDLDSQQVRVPQRLVGSIVNMKCQASVLGYDYLEARSFMMLLTKSLSPCG